MSEIELERKLFELTDVINKATFMVESFIDQYRLDSGEVKNQCEAILFAYSKASMFMNMSIIQDYLFLAKRDAEVLKEGVVCE